MAKSLQQRLPKDRHRSKVITPRTRLHPRRPLRRDENRPNWVHNQQDLPKSQICRLYNKNTASSARSPCSLHFTLWKNKHRGVQAWHPEKKTDPTNTNHFLHDNRDGKPSQPSVLGMCQTVQVSPIIWQEVPEPHILSHSLPEHGQTHQRWVWTEWTLHREQGPTQGDQLPKAPDSLLCCLYSQKRPQRKEKVEREIEEGQKAPEG